MKRLIATVIFILLVTSLSLKLFSQGLYPVSSDEKIAKSTLIVEGKVIRQTSFWNPAHTMIFTENEVEVFKVFKGQTSRATIEILTQGGSVGNEAVVASELLSLKVGEAGVFFCYLNSINLRSPNTGEILFDIYSSAQGFLKYDPINNSANAPFARYADIKKELHVELQQKTQRSFEDKKPGIDISSVAHVNGPSAINAPSITSFSPSTVNAGAILDPTNNLLTITGTGFGTLSGSAAVFFDNANDGTGGSFSGEGVGSPRITSWTDTEIKIRVPTYAGTGVFIVRDAAGVTSTSSTNLQVLYSIIELTISSGGTFAKEGNLMDDNGLGGYTVLYSTNTAGSGTDFDASLAKPTFQRALATWKERFGFNVIEGGTTTNQSASAVDGSNVVMYDNANTGNPPLAAGVLATCYTFYSMCLPVATNELQIIEFDIVVRSSFSTGSTTFSLGPCPPTSGQVDMESVMLHELGHAIGLAHINDSWEGGPVPTINPEKVMNFAIVPGVKRTSPDFSAASGATYQITPQGNAYGSCGLPVVEMTPLSTTTESRDECPGSFPTTGTAPGTNVSFDLVHATSNKFVDAQSTAINCAGTRTGVTNTAYYAFKTNSTGGILSLSVSGYGTTPASQSSCTGAGIELAIYAVSSCPAGQAFPAPFACRTFNANGAITDITGLAGNTTYLMLLDGIDNTKANFTLTFGGSALPINISSFTGQSFKDHNYLQWKIDFAKDVKAIYLEKSGDATNFERVTDVTQSLISKKGDFKDFRPFAINNYYRLAVTNRDGTIEYSKVILLKRNDEFLVSVFPNPATDVVNVEVNSMSKTGRYSVRLRNNIGQEIFRTNLSVTGTRQKIEFNVGQLPSGMYQVSVYDQQEKMVKSISIRIN